MIDISIVKPYPKGDENGWPGWRFPASNDEYPGATVDGVFGSEYLHEVYFKADKGYKGRYSVPVLWDRETGGIVNNESAELMRDLQTGFNGLLLDGDDEDRGRAGVTLYPERLRRRIDEVAEWMQRDLNTGVYKAGFAETQEMYDRNACVCGVEQAGEDDRGERGPVCSRGALDGVGCEGLLYGCAV
jgi:putative glutathione S-transferase